MIYSARHRRAESKPRGPLYLAEQHATTIDAEAGRPTSFEISRTPQFIGTFPHGRQHDYWTSSYRIAPAARPRRRSTEQVRRGRRARRRLPCRDALRRRSTCPNGPGVRHATKSSTCRSRRPVERTTLRDLSRPLNLPPLPRRTDQTVALPSILVFLVRPVSAASAPPTSPVAAVSLTGPSNGHQATAPATLNVTATANILNDQIRDVSFYAGNALIGTDTQSPFSASWPSVPAGTYVVQARVTGMSGASALSNTATVTVAVALPPPPPPCTGGGKEPRRS